MTVRIVLHVANEDPALRTAPVLTIGEPDREGLPASLSVNHSYAPTLDRMMVYPYNDPIETTLLMLRRTRRLLESSRAGKARLLGTIAATEKTILNTQRLILRSDELNLDCAYLLKGIAAPDSDHP